MSLDVPLIDTVSSYGCEEDIVVKGVGMMTINQVNSISRAFSRPLSDTGPKALSQSAEANPEMKNTFNFKCQKLLDLMAPIYSH